MEVPFRLARRETAAVADAYLLFAEEAAPLAETCVRFGDALPDVFAVRGGFVLVSPAADARHIPGAIRLRRMGADLFIPADAELLPALLPDEIAALTRDRGLVVLPGGEVLAFDTATPLPVSAWLAPARIRRESWQPFPPRPERPETLSVIERPSPPAAVLEVLAGGAPEGTAPLGGAGSGSEIPEDARPSAGSAIGRVAAGVGLGVAGFLAWLGKKLGAPGLARLGGNLAAKALAAVPRLTEKVLGEQEAALREVLRQLRSGDVEKGLRRAPVAVPDPDRPSRVGTDARLGNRDPRYSLRDLIGSGGGVATGWLGGGDVWAELAREYRRLAEEAAARGDFRRAAYIHGVLLRDLRSAANVLLRGGLCHDAALLFRDRLNDPLSAAQAFERAGDHDEAIRLYDQNGHFEKAAELLRQLGDEERALAYFVRAADQLAARGFLLKAGDLVRTKAGRHDLATGYFRRGWEGTTAESVTCGERLLDAALVTEDLPAAHALLTDAETRLANRPAAAGTFFNYALDIGENFLPAEERADLADRVRLIFAAHVRSAGSSTDGVRLAGELFGGPRPWAGPVVRDSTFAARGNDPRPAEPEGPAPVPVRLAAGTVTAVAVARGTGDIFVATTEAVVCWKVGEGRVVPVCRAGADDIAAVSVDPRGETVCVLYTRDNEYFLHCFAAERSGSFTPMGTTSRTLEDPDAGFHLQPSATFRDGDYRVVLAVGERRLGFVSRYLRPASSYPWPDNGHPTHLLAESPDRYAWDWGDGWIRCWSRSDGEKPPLIGQWVETWFPAKGRAAPAIDWITPGPAVLEVAGIDGERHARWAEFDAHDPHARRSRYASALHPDGYATVCLAGPGSVVAVTTRNEIRWLRVAGSVLVVAAWKKLDVPSAVVALVARPAQSEVIAILADGQAVRVPRP